MQAAVPCEEQGEYGEESRPGAVILVPTSGQVNAAQGCTKPHGLAQPELSGTGRAESSRYGGVCSYPLEHLDAPLDRAHRGAVLGCQVTETSFALPVSLCDGFSGLQGQVRKGRTPDRLTLRPGVSHTSLHPLGNQ